MRVAAARAGTHLVTERFRGFTHAVGERKPTHQLPGRAALRRESASSPWSLAAKAFGSASSPFRKESKSAEHRPLSHWWVVKTITKEICK